MLLDDRPAAGPPVARAGAVATGLRTLDLLRRLSWVPDRAVRPGLPECRPDIQFDLDRDIPPPAVVDGVRVRFAPVHTVFATAVLTRTPTRRDQRVLADVLDAVERAYPLFTHVAYGLPYFRRLPAGLVALYMPRLLTDSNRFVLEETGPSGHDDVLFTLRGDDPAHLAGVLRWLGRTDLPAGLRLTSTRAMFSQPGLPRRIALHHGLPYAHRLDPRSPTWTGGVEEPAGEAAGPCGARRLTFEGARITTASAGDYFDTGAVQELRHDVLDLDRLYADGYDEAFTERVRHAFRQAAPVGRGRPVAPVPSDRVDGPGFDGLDVPGGAPVPKRQATVFAPAAAALAQAGGADGLRHYLTASRRQTFLVPPRRHRAFPLLELA